MDDDTMARDAAGQKRDHGYELLIRIFLEVTNEKRARKLLGRLGDGCAIDASAFHIQPAPTRPGLYECVALYVLPWDMRAADAWVEIPPRFEWIGSWWWFRVPNLEGDGTWEFEAICDKPDPSGFTWAHYEASHSSGVPESIYESQPWERLPAEWAVDDERGPRTNGVAS
jgi:hypothetical protein